VCLIHDVPSIFCLSSTLEGKHACHRNQNELVLKEKGKKKEGKKRNKESQDFQTISYYRIRVGSSPGKKFGSLGCFIIGPASLLPKLFSNFMEISENI